MRSGGRTRRHADSSDPRLPEILFEQLDYLIQFADQECDRLDRVKAILMEAFH